jgi:1-aminocyclopropane-1-carboxylate deaminase/D-cysteine desulfhydrase-like pyridoxal-dependent ACC family enzyme
MTPERLRQRLDSFAPVSFGLYPTPLEPLATLSRELGGPRLWIKRDDGIGPAMGGNKGRKLDFLMGDVLRQHKGKVATFGGLQSNHARMTAAACASLDLKAHLFFFARRPATLEGNLALDSLLGARLHFIPLASGGDGSLSIEATIRLVRWLATLVVGPGLYFVPVGGHTAVGALGYVSAALEIHEQAVSLDLPLERTTIVVAAGTGGTLAGLAAGLALLRSPMQVLGIDVGRLWRRFPESVATLATQACLVLGEARPFTGPLIPIIERTYVGPGYAILTPAAREAIALMAGREGILLDPVYTGKAWAGLLDLTRNGHFAADEHVIFLHSGGAPGLFAYGDELTG